MSELQADSAAELPEPGPASLVETHGVTLRAISVDEFGTEHITISHTTIPPHVFREKGRVIRGALDAFYATMGQQLVSLTREIMAEPVVITAASAAPERKRHLRLVASGGRRIMSEDAKLLAASAGLSEQAARQSIYGDEP